MGGSKVVKVKAKPLVSWQQQEAEDLWRRCCTGISLNHSHDAVKRCETCPNNWRETGGLLHCKLSIGFASDIPKSTKGKLGWWKCRPKRVLLAQGLWTCRIFLGDPAQIVGHLKVIEIGKALNPQKEGFHWTSCSRGESNTRLDAWPHSCFFQDLNGLSQSCSSVYSRRKQPPHCSVN